MSTGLIQPKETVQAAIKAGILKGPMCSENGILGHTNEEIKLMVRLPEEAGIARLPICPKVDRRRLPKPKQVRRCGSKERSSCLFPPRTMRYVITKKDRPELFK